MQHSFAPVGLGDHVIFLWTGVVQRNPNQGGTRRDYKWLKSDVNADDTDFFGRYVDRDTEAACALLQPQAFNPNYKLSDDDCANKFRGFICEW